MVIILALMLAIPLGLDLYMPVPEDNPMTSSKARSSGESCFTTAVCRVAGAIACASCHDPERAFSDSRPLAVGVFGRIGQRHAPALINRGYGRSFFWDGRIATLEEQVLKPIQDPNEMDLTASTRRRRALVWVCRRSRRRLPATSEAFSRATHRYDRFINGDRRALTDEQQRGMQIFRGRGNCTACHVGPTFSDERFHNTGVAWQNDQAAGRRTRERHVQDADAARGRTHRAVHARRQSANPHRGRRLLQRGRPAEPVARIPISGLRA